MNSENQRTLFQRAGEIIVNKYNNIKDIPDKYLFFYKNYIPLSIGQKRKYLVISRYVVKPLNPKQSVANLKKERRKKIQLLE